MDRGKGLNQFNEEACRDLFVELGIEIAREYRYTQGIREVQARVLEAFGEDHYPHAMRLFDDLLQGETNALGLGDEGDLWRSWRHEYQLKKTQMSRPKSAHFPRIPSPSPSAAFAQFHQRPTSSYAVLEPAVEPSLLPSEQYPSFGQSEDFQIEEAVVVNIRKSQPNILSKLHSYRALNHEAGFPPPRNLRTKISQVLGRGASQLSSKHQNIALSNPISPSSPVAPKLPPIFFDGCCDESTAVASDDEPRASGETLIDVYRFPTPPSAQDPLESLSMTAEELLGGIGHPGIAELPTTSHRDDLDDKRNTCNSGSSGSQSSKLSQFSGSSRTQFTRIARDAFQTALLQRDGPSNVSYEQGTAQEGLQTPQGTLFQSPEIESPRYQPTLNTEDPYGHWYGRSDARDTTMSSLVSQQSLLHHDIDNLLPRGPLPSSYSEGSLQTLATTSQPKEKHRPNPVQVSRGRSRGNSSVSTQPSSPTRTLQTINENSSQDISNLTRAPLSRSVSPTKNSTYRASIEVAEDTSLIGRRSTEKSQGDAASARRPRSPLKKLFGEHGWLSKSSSMKDLGSDLSRPSHLQRLGNRLKGKVGDLTIEVTKFKFQPINSQISPSSPLPPHLLIAITQDPPNQARLYAELELMITASANRFLLQQTSIGRISPETVSKVTTAWKNKGRPQVIEFQFDQLTQRDLILYNLPTVRFGGRRALNAKHCDGVMLAWRRLGKEMACRTFCAPDSMLRKHLHDAAKLLELLGAPLTTLIAFDELAVRTVRAMDEEQGKRRAWAEAVMGKERVFETPLTPRTPRTLGGDGRAGAGDGSVRKWPVRSGYSEGDLVGKGKNLEVSPFMKYAG